MDDATAARFWAKVALSGPMDCWLWTATRSTEGYGRFVIQRRAYQAHRLAYEALVGPIPAGHTLDHLCRVRACVNPAHLEPVTNRENVLRGVGLSAQNARKTHCKRGHAFVLGNIEWKKGHGRIERRCRECRLEQQRVWYSRHRGRKNSPLRLLDTTNEGAETE